MLAKSPAVLTGESIDALLKRRRLLSQELNDAKTWEITWHQEETIDRLHKEIERIDDEIVALEEAGAL